MGLCFYYFSRFLQLASNLRAVQNVSLVLHLGSSYPIKPDTRGIETSKRQSALHVKQMQWKYCYLGWNENKVLSNFSLIFSERIMTGQVVWFLHSMCHFTNCIPMEIWGSLIFLIGKLGIPEGDAWGLISALQWQHKWSCSTQGKINALL